VLEACSDKTVSAQPAVADPAEAASVASVSVPSSADDQYAKRLTDLGATDGAHGWELALSSADYQSGQVAFEPQDEGRIEHVADLLKAQSTVHATIESYTDDQGTQSANQLLSQKRAEAVVKALTQRGVPEGCVFRARKASDSRHAGPWFHAMSVQCS
jgi:outer membrane protein OmpA-like peptidoglycan-associated protein